MRRWGVAVPIYLLIATAIGFADYRMRAHPARGYEAYPQAVVANTEEVPGKYRVLAPFAFEGVIAATGADRQVLWVVFRWLTLLAGLIATHLLLATWFGASHAIAGSMFSALALLLTFTNSWPHPDHLVEWALSAAAVAAIARARHAWFVGLVVLAALNRETSAFLVLLYAVAAPWPWSTAHVRRTAAWSALWGLLYLGLRYWRGIAWYDPWQVTRNIEFLRLLPDTYDPYFRAYAWFGVVLLAPVAWLGWRSWPDQPRLAKAAALVVVPVFVVTAFCFSSIVETRIFTPLIPMLAVLVMFAVVHADRSDADRS